MSPDPEDIVTAKPVLSAEARAQLAGPDAPHLRVRDEDILPMTASSRPLTGLEALDVERIISGAITSAWTGSEEFAEEIGPTGADTGRATTELLDDLTAAGYVIVRRTP